MSISNYLQDQAGTKINVATSEGYSQREQPENRNNLFSLI